MSKLNLIIKREFQAKIRNKSFIVMTFLSPMLFVLIGVIVGYLSSIESNKKIIAIHDSSGMFVSDFKNNDEYTYVDLTPIDVELVKDRILNENYEGVLIIPNVKEVPVLEKEIKFISNESPSTTFVTKMEKVISQRLTEMNLINAGLDTQVIKKAKSNFNIRLLKTSGEQSISGINELKIAIGGAFGYLIMMFIIMYGNMVMRSVIEEKVSRIIEVIVSSVKPFQLMMGKIIGTSLAGILQFVIWTVLGLTAMFILSNVFGVAIGNSSGVEQKAMQVMQPAGMNEIQMYVRELWNLPIATILISFVIFFIGGYFLYSSFYASIGAAVDNDSDTQQFLLPIILPLILGVYVGFFVVMENPHSTISTVFSMLPLTSPIVMMMRIPFGVPLWQIIVSAVLLFGTAIGVVWFAAKIYRVGILMYGKKPTWKELYKWSKY